MESPSLTEAQRGMKRLEDMLQSVSAIDTLDSLAPSAQTVSLEDLVRSATDGLPLEVRIAGSCHARGGPPLVSAIRNIVRNAEQHSESRLVDITIHREGEYCVTRIADSGKGIPANVREKLFQEGASFGNTAGSGLGLYIAKKIIAAYGGQIDVTDNKPQGTVFEVRLRSADPSDTERLGQEA
jgi:signal transduction histidine kinase